MRDNSLPKKKQSETTHIFSMLEQFLNTTQPIHDKNNDYSLSHLCSKQISQNESNALFTLNTKKNNKTHVIKLKQFEPEADDHLIQYKQNQFKNEIAHLKTLFRASGQSLHNSYHLKLQSLGNNLYFLMPYLGKYNATQLIQQYLSKCNYLLFYHLLESILTIISTLHQPPYQLVHGDLSSDNIMVIDEGASNGPTHFPFFKVVLIDPEFATQIGNEIDCTYQTHANDCYWSRDRIKISRSLNPTADDIAEIDKKSPPLAAPFHDYLAFFRFLFINNYITHAQVTDTPLALTRRAALSNSLMSQASLNVDDLLDRIHTEKVTLQSQDTFTLPINDQHVAKYTKKSLARQPTYGISSYSPTPSLPVAINGNSASYQSPATVIGCDTRKAPDTIRQRKKTPRLQKRHRENPLFTPKKKKSKLKKSELKRPLFGTEKLVSAV